MDDYQRNQVNLGVGESDESEWGERRESDKQFAPAREWSAEPNSNPPCVEEQKHISIISASRQRLL